MPVHGVHPSRILERLNGTQINAAGYEVQEDQVLTSPHPYIDLDDSGSTKDTQSRSVLSLIHSLFGTHGLMEEGESASS